MSKKTVVITGAGSGLGASLATKFSVLGWHVCLLGRTKEKLVRTSMMLNNDFSIYTVDVSSKVSVQKVMNMILKDCGPIDCLVNNAGVGTFKYAEELNEHEIDQMIDINLKGTIFCTLEVLLEMKKQNRGHIVNIISSSGKVAKSIESVYSASKFGVRGFTEALTEELEGTNIHLFGAYMGNMKTNLWGDDYKGEELEAYMDPDDVAEIIMENLKQRNNLQVSEVTILNKVQHD